MVDTDLHKKKHKPIPAEPIAPPPTPPPPPSKPIHKFKPIVPAAAEPPRQPLPPPPPHGYQAPVNSYREMVDDFTLGSPYLPHPALYQPAPEYYTPQGSCSPNVLIGCQLHVQEVPCSDYQTPEYTPLPPPPPPHIHSYESPAQSYEAPPLCPIAQPPQSCAQPPLYREAYENEQQRLYFNRNLFPNVGVPTPISNFGAPTPISNVPNKEMKNDNKSLPTTSATPSINKSTDSAQVKTTIPNVSSESKEKNEKDSKVQPETKSLSESDTSTKSLEHTTVKTDEKKQTNDNIPSGEKLKQFQDMAKQMRESAFQPQPQQPSMPMAHQGDMMHFNSEQQVPPQVFQDRMTPQQPILPQQFTINPPPIHPQMMSPPPLMLGPNSAGGSPIQSMNFHNMQTN